MTRLPTTPSNGLRGIQPDHVGRSTTTWQAVRNEVLTRIRSQEWPAGALIPTEKELAAELGCARATVNRALRELADNGVLERRRKVGTRVAATPSPQAARETSVISNEIRALEAEYSYRLIRFQHIRPSETIARHLQISRDDDVVLTVALHLADSKPYCCETVWLNQPALPPVTEAELTDQSAQEWLARVATLTHEQIAITAQSADQEVAVNMRLSIGTPVLTIERTSWADKNALAYARQVYQPGHRVVPST